MSFQTLDIILGVVVVLAFIGIIVFFVALSKKDNEKQAERMKMLSQEQFDYIQKRGYTPYSQDGKLLKTVAVLTNIKEGTSKFAPVDFIFYNCCTKRFELGDDKISRDVIANTPLKVGDYIELVIKFKNGFIDSVKEIGPLR